MDLLNFESSVFNLNTSINYRGEYETLPTTGKYGDLIYYDGVYYVCGGNDWDPVNDIKQTHIDPQICSRCGAPLHGNRCEYCETEYR